MTLGRPAGDFVVSETTSKLLLVSGGSGATPVMSILRDLARHDAVRDVVYVHAARSKRDVIFERELEALARRHRGLSVSLFLETDGGRLDVSRLERTVADFATRDAMLCGPAPMMEALAPMWRDAGIAERLKTERFTPQVAPSPRPSGTAVTLTLSRTGRSVVGASGGRSSKSSSAGGERPASGCRMGICNSCVCRKSAGVVENIVTGKISSEPDEDIRLCVSRARTDVSLAI